jgi:hypothetical protein
MRAWGAVLVLAACEGGDKSEESEESLAGLDDAAVVFINGTEIEDQQYTWVAAMAFQDVPTIIEAPEIVLDLCEFEALTTGSTPGTETPQMPVSAGEITVELDGVAIDLEDNGSFMPSTELEGWPAGSVVSFSATGDVFPAFDVPELLVVPDNPGPASVQTASDGSLELAWSGSSDTMMLLSVSWDDGWLYCYLTDDGSFTVPADELVGTGERTVALSRFVGGWQREGDVMVQGMASINVELEE